MPTSIGPSPPKPPDGHGRTLTEITQEYKKEKPGKSVPDDRFRVRRERPLFLVHVVEPTNITAEAKAPSDVLVALGLSFPQFDDSDIAKRVKYVVNLVEWNAMVQDEADDFIEEDLDDDAG